MSYWYHVNEFLPFPFLSQIQRPKEVVDIDTRKPAKDNI